MKKTKKGIDLEERVPMHTYMRVKQYIYVARLARLARHHSIQKILDSFIPLNWEKENEELAEVTRKMGYKEWEFYPPRLLKRMGIMGPNEGGRRWSKKRRQWKKKG